MDSVYSISELGCSFLKLTYEEWLAIQEPLFFNFVGAQDESHWLFLQNAPYLFAYSVLVKLIRVGDKIYKLDGKQRKDVWNSAKITPPEFLIAQVFDITEADFSDLITRARNKQMELLSPQDAVKVVYAELGLIFNSERIRNGFINEAINIALRGKQRALQDKRSKREREEIDIKKAIHCFSTELKLIDDLNPDVEIFKTGVLAGILIMLGLNKKIDEFLVRLNEKRGESIDGRNDPIASLLNAINKFNNSGRTSYSGQIIGLCGKTIQAVTLWEEGNQSPKYWRKLELTGLDLMPYIQDMKRLKKIHVQRDL